MRKSKILEKIIICGESDPGSQNLKETLSKIAITGIHPFQKLVSEEFGNEATLLVIEFKEIDDINHEKFKLLRDKFGQSSIIVLQHANRNNRNIDSINEEFIKEGADHFLVLPSQASIVEPVVRKLLGAKEKEAGLIDELNRKNTLFLAHNELFSELDEKNLLRKAIERTLTLTGAEGAAISLIRQNGTIYTEAWEGNTWYLKNDNETKGNNPSGDTNKNEPSPANGYSTHLDKNNYRSYLDCPLLDRDGNIAGVFEIAGSSENIDTVKNQEILRDIAKSVSLVVENLNMLNYTKSKLESAKFYDKSFRYLIENSPYSIILIQHNKIKFANKKTIASLGYSKNELINRNIIDIISPENANDFMDAVKKVLNSRSSNKITINLLSKSGDPVKYELEINSMIYEGNQSIQLISREVGPELGISKETVRLAAAVNSLHTAVTITDMDRKIIYVNPAHKKSFGYEPKELLGKDIGILFPFDDPSGVSEKIYDAIQIVGWEGERIGVRKNKEVFPVYEKISVVKDKTGTSVGIVSILEEISKRKRLEQALKESEERYRTLVDTANTSIIAVDEKGKITFINPAAEKLFEYKKDEILNKDISILIPERYKTLFEQKIKNSTETELSTYMDNTVEFTGLRKSGEEVPLEMSISKCRIEGTRIYTAIVMDITERKNLQEQLIQSAKLAAIGELISGVTHEINNPLAIVLGYAEMMLAEPEMDEDLRKYINIIYKESERARKVIQNLLSFARQHNPEKESISVNDLLDDTIMLAEYDIKKNNIKLKKNYEQNLPNIMADPNQLQQVFLNLIINAQQAVTERNGNGEITLETSVKNRESAQKDKRVLISISDNGCGIRKEVLNKIFDPFFTTKPVNKGTGLGLSVSHGIIKEHGGNIYARNNEDEGATFYIELPV